MLSLIFPTADQKARNLILNELEFWAQDYDKERVKDCVKAIGRCAQTEPKNSTRCLRLLLRQVESKDGTLVAESLTVVRHIIQQNPSQHAATVINLAKALDTTSNPAARASIIWLVGEFAGDNDGNNIAADTLRILAKGFHDEAEAAKLQIVLLAAKVYTHYLNRKQPARDFSQDLERISDDEEDTDPIVLLFQYILVLARYDVSYDIRDRARMYKSLLSVPSSTQLATLLLLAPKPVPHAPSPSEGVQDFTVGSAAMVLRAQGETDAAGLRGYEKLPDWVKAEDAPPREVRNEGVEVRDEGVEGSASARIQKVVVREKEEKKEKKEAATLDQWLESEEEEEEEESEEETEEETDSEEDDDDEEEEESEYETEDETDERKGMLPSSSK